ncbi:MAG: GNAT family N-acetyltransferase [Clostridia bacterium]|nr:GNAT family N-acetyltransferase [Clostridia bacterium]
MKDRIRKAKKSDLERIFEMYSSAIGREGCTWNELYPTYKEINNDYAHGCLYVYLHCDQVIGAVSVVLENELDEIDLWKIKDGSQKEIARVVIADGFTGIGFAGKMINCILKLLSKKGCRGVHLLVAKCNTAAVKLYKKSGFDYLGETSMYGNVYYIGERML